MNTLTNTSQEMSGLREGIGEDFSRSVAKHKPALGEKNDYGEDREDGVHIETMKGIHLLCEALVRLWLWLKDVRQWEGLQREQGDCSEV